eukprot:m.248708 g.248708  ORF g.248708 m.248708 type:complete len:79 (+) comp40292_c0_seq4:1-237(+)
MEERMGQLRALASQRGLYMICYRMIAAEAAGRPSAQECLASIAREQHLCFESGIPQRKRLVEGKFQGAARVVVLSEGL